MHKSQKLWRALSIPLLTAALCGSFVFSEVNEPVRAAPRQVVSPPHMVISEFRTRGPAGADDEYVEIFNATGNNVDLSNWKISKSSSCGTTTADLTTIPGGVTLIPGQYYLIGNSGFSGAVDRAFTSALADDGGIALIDNGGKIIDQVGMCNGTSYKEPPTLAKLTSDVEQSYERKSANSPGSCTDTDNNAADFLLNSSSSNPQNSSSSPMPCLVVTNVTSPAADGTYTTGATIDITVSFSSPVNVAGTPTLLLETGVTDRTATYVSGSGSETLTFRYTVANGDSAGDLDYVAADSLALNGGAIIGAIGNANLALPTPGAAGSLGANKNIVIDNGLAPNLASIKRQNPTTSPTNATSLVFRATFSETVTNVDAADFTLHVNTSGPQTTATITGINPALAIIMT